MRTSGQRAGLDRDAVLGAARAVVAERGSAGLSMRAVATRLGVAPNALYSHVASKEDLVDAILDDLLGALEPPPADVDAHDGLVALMTATHDLLLATPDLVPLYLGRQGARGPHARALGAAMDALLARAGTLDADGRATAVRVLVVGAIGSAALAGGGGPVPVDELRASYAAGLRWLLTGMGI